MPLFGPPNIEKMKAKEDVHGLIKALGYQKDPAIPQAASAVLVELGSRAVKPLIDALHDKDKAVQDSTAEVLVRIGEPAVDSLVKAVTGWKIDTSAIRVLNQLGNQEALLKTGEQLLERMLNKRLEVQYRMSAASALAEIGPPLVDSLVSFLKDPLADQSCGMQGAMCFILAYNMDKMPHHSDLMKTLAVRVEKGISLRGLTAGVLGEIGDTRAVKPLLELLTAQDDLTRWVAAGSLFSIGEPKATEPLLSHLAEQDLLVAGKGSAWLLIGDGGTVKPLLAEMNAGKPDAAETLKKLGWGKTARR